MKLKTPIGHVECAEIADVYGNWAYVTAVVNKAGEERRFIYDWMNYPYLTLAPRNRDEVRLEAGEFFADAIWGTGHDVSETYIPKDLSLS